MEAADADNSPRQTLASAMYRQLREDILAGVLPPDAKLNIRELCDRFSVGLSPAREALSRLSAEGLVQQTDNRGFAVMPISLAEFLDLTKARCWINEIGLRQSIALGDAAWEEAVLLAYHRLSRTPRHIPESGVSRNPAWENAHRHFHRALLEGCGSQTLVDTCERLFEASERYRHLGRITGKARGSHESEHRDLMQAAIDRRADKAVELLNAHFQRTADLVCEVVGEKETAVAAASHGPRIARSVKSLKRG